MEEALAQLKEDLSGVREEIIIHTQFRRNTAVSPTDPSWGQPNPIDIDGIIEMAFRAGTRYERRKDREKR